VIHYTATRSLFSSTNHALAGDSTLEICPYCGTRNPLPENVPAGQPPRCSDCGGVLDDLSMTATQIAMGPWFFRLPNKPYGPGCDITILRKLLAAGRIKPDAPVRGPSTHQLWQRVSKIPGIAHLAGLCHSCGSSVKPDGKFCPDCGTKFETPTQRNEWNLPTQPVSQVIANLRQADGNLCCVCGHDKAAGDECPQCETIFSPADEATRITLGGWFIHGKAHAYKPGMSYEHLRKEIEIGSVTGRSIVRGPTTHQFWQLAKNTPGIAHLTGSCHACSEKVAASSTSCPACNASFSVPSDADWVGLRYPTAQAAAAAQSQLDAELAEIAATLPPLPPVKTKLKAPSQEEMLVTEVIEDDGDVYEALDESENAFEHVEEEAEVDEAEVEQEEVEEAEVAHEEYAQAHDEFEASVTDEPEPHHELAMATAPDDRGSIDLHAAAAAVPADGGSSNRDRRATAQYKKSQTTLIAWLIITPLVLIGAYFAISALSNMNKDGDKDSAAAKDSTKGPAVVHKAQASDQLTKLRNDAQARIALFKSADRKGKFAAPLNEADALFAAGNAMIDKEQFFEADAEFRKIEPLILQVERLQKQRAIATESRGRAVAAQNEAKAVVAAQHAKEQWDEADKSFELGNKLLAEEDFDQAIVAWTNSAEQFGKATRLVQVMLTAADVRAKIDADAIKTFSREELDRENIPAWNAVKGKLKAGDEAITAKNFEEGMQYYDQARLMVPSLDFAMKLQIGRSFYAYQAGRLTARILIAKGAAYHPDDEMLAQLKTAYENLQINRDFYNRIPLNKNCSYRDLANIMITECAKEIETTFEAQGLQLRSSFALGMHLFIVEKLLRADVGKMSSKSKEDIDLYVKRIIPEAAKNAAYAPAFAAAVTEFEETLATETNIPTKSREKWAQLIEKLDSFDTAMKIVIPKQ